MNGPADPRGHAGDPDERDLPERGPVGPESGLPESGIPESGIPESDGPEPEGPSAVEREASDGPDTGGPEPFGDLGDPADPADLGEITDITDLGDIGDLGDLLGLPIEPMPIPEGAFAQIRRRAVRRKRKRALVGATACVAVLGVSLYFVGVPGPQGPGQVVTPPASATQAAPTPSPVATSPTQSATPSAVPTTAPSRSASPSTSVPTPQVSASATPGVGPTSSGSGGGSTTPLCTAAQLGAALGRGNAGAGQIYTYLVVTNRSSTACHVTGYPGLSMLDAHGTQIGAPATYENLAFSPVVLTPGASASDTIHTVNRQTNSPSECLPTSTSLRIYPPGSRASFVFPGQLTNCDNLFSVTPFGPGVTGNPPN